jgi:predicted metal-dependent HD superfamily phosphohydrolase
MLKITKEDKLFFEKIMGKLAIKANFEIMKIIINLYSRPERFYHNFTHIRTSLRRWKKYYLNFKDSALSGLALLFHDIETGLEHEKSSAETMLAFMKIYKPYLSETELTKIYLMIMMTKPTSQPLTNDEKLVHDIDLLGFANSYQSIIKANIKLRKEYQGSLEEFLQDNTAFLKKLLNCSHIFYHPIINAKKEKIARRNINRLIDKEKKELLEILSKKWIEKKFSHNPGNNQPEKHETKNFWEDNCPEDSYFNKSLCFKE